MLNKRILIVEDEPMIGLDLSTRLERCGYQIIGVATDGVAALKLFKESAIDLILLDISLQSDMNGIQFAEIIRITSDVPIIYITAYSDEATLNKAKLTQPSGFLLKPFNYKELETTIEISLYKYQAEKRIKESERWFHSTLEGISDAIVTTDNNGIINFANPAALTTIGLDNEKLLGQHFNNIVKFANPNLRFTPINNTYDENDKSNNDNSFVITKLFNYKNERLDIEFKQTLIKDDFGNVSGTIFLIRDITERKKTEEVIRSSEEKLRTLFDTMAQGILYQDENGTIQSANQAACKILGCSIKNLIGSSLANSIWQSRREDGTIIPSEEHPTTLAIKSGKEIVDYTFGIVNQLEDNYRWIVISCIPYCKPGDEKPSSVFSSFTDITELKKSEEALKSYGAELKHVIATKDRFFSIVAHDLKSPFLGLLGFTTALNEEFDDFETSQIRRYIGNINKATRNLYGLIQNLLEWSRLQTNKLEISIRPVNIYHTIDCTINLLLPNAASKDITIKNLLPTNKMVSTDERILDSIISNLIANAIKFTKRNGNIIVYAKEKNNAFQICVEDNGIGMDEEKLNELFKLDITVSSRGTEGEAGTGLGLVLCQELIAKINGTINVESKPGMGSKFFITLPDGE